VGVNEFRHAELFGYAAQAGVTKPSREARLRT
jgi:hypothetical protein